jgi:hypothetical protein
MTEWLAPFLEWLPLFLIFALPIGMVVLLGGLHPDREKRRIRRSIKIGPLALGIALAMEAPIPMLKPADECDWRPQIKTMLWEARRRGVNVSDDWQSIEDQMLDPESRCLMARDEAAVKRQEGWR